MLTEEKNNEAQSTESEFQCKERTFSVGDMVSYKPLGERNKIYWKRGRVIEVSTGCNDGMYLVEFNIRSIEGPSFGKISWQNLWF